MLAETVRKNWIESLLLDDGQAYRRIIGLYADGSIPFKDALAIFQLRFLQEFTFDF